MLRESARAHDLPVNVLAVTQPQLDSGVPHGAELLALVDAMALLDFYELPDARAELVAAAGPGAATRAVAVCANFEGINRVVDAIGVPVNKRFYDIGNDLGVQVPTHLR